MACSTRSVRARLLLLVALLTAGVLTAGIGLMVVMGYVEPAGLFTGGMFGAVGGGMIGAGFRRWRKYRALGLGHTRGTRQRETSATSHQ